MERHELTDEQWPLIEPLLPPSRGRTGWPSPSHHVWADREHVRRHWPPTKDRAFHASGTGFEPAASSRSFRTRATRQPATTVGSSSTGRRGMHSARKIRKAVGIGNGTKPGQVGVQEKRRSASHCLLSTCEPRLFGNGEGGIRTPGTVARTPHFECGSFGHSDTSPGAFDKNVDKNFVA